GPDLGGHERSRPPHIRRRHRCADVRDPHVGGYPDGVAFAVLIMNACAPLIDRYTIPRIYGHSD
ncbi:MAG TPA: RnfABCDGE type electron transport complex subunit D, partial [Steroidobacter sp.]|nr:RnfABCDGE type electron transport complex subunit D [Steroidobacter sp.]